MISRFPESDVYSARRGHWYLVVLLIIGILLAHGPRLTPPLDRLGISSLAVVLAQPEVVAWRTEGSRHYDLGGGRYAAVIMAQQASGSSAATLGIVQEAVQGSVALVEGQPANDRPAFAQSCVGHFVGADEVRSVRRAFVQFPLAALPANVGSADISSAAFFAAPDGTLAPGGNTPEPFFEEYGFTELAVTVHAVEDDSWIAPVGSKGNLTDWPATSAALAPLVETDDYLWKDDDASAWLATGWDATSAVQGWFDIPANNFGLALRIAGEENYADYTVPEEGLPATFMCFPTPADYTYVTTSDGNPIAPNNTSGPGMALLVTYTLPTLATDVLLTTNVPSTAPTGAYVNQAHHYNLQPSAERWQLLVTRGNPVAGQSLPNVPTELFRYTSGLGSSQVRADNGRGLPNYIAINPDATPAGDTLIVQVLPETSPEAPDHDDKQYVLQFLEARAVPRSMPLPSGSSIDVQLPLPQNHLVLGQALEFAADTTVEVRIEGLRGENDVRIFPPSSQYESRDGAAALPLVYDGQAHEIEFSVRDATSGVWLLAFTHIGFDPVAPIAQVTVCANGDDVVRYPLEGECVELRRPDPADFSDDTLKTIGDVRVYSSGGFSGNCVTGCETINFAPTGEPIMPLIGHVDNAHEWVALKGGTATVFSGFGARVDISPGTRLVMADFADSDNIVSMPVLRGEFEVSVSGAVTAVSSPANTLLLVNSPMSPADDKEGTGDKNGWTYEIDLAIGRMEAAGPAARAVQPTPNALDATHTFSFDAHWSISAHGGASLTGSVALVNVTPLPIPVGVLLLSPPQDGGYTLEYDPLSVDGNSPQEIPAFQQIRFSGATLAQPADLGGARVTVQGVLLNPDVEPEQAPAIHCRESCLSLRGPADSLSAPDYAFRMPDLLIQNEANLLAFGDAQGVTFVSSDHPQSAATLNAISFSFEAFDGEVSMRQGRCPGVRDPFNPQGEPSPEGPLTTIVEGVAFMNIPGIGAGNTDVSGAPALTAEFMLCSSSLREVSLVLTLGETAVPLGNSGLFLNKVGGYISITPEATTITLEVGLQALAPTAIASNIFIGGWLMIDTRGLIDVHANARARVVGSLGYGATGHVWVGWAPLDIGFEVRGCLPHSTDSFLPKPNFQTPDSQNETSDLCTGSELLFGMIRAHLWQGAGWQDRYPHLLGSPPDATHFAGRFEADVTIAEGVVADWGLFKLPPVEVKAREVDLAVGEFCTNTSCTEYEWGVMGAYGMLGVQVGLYYDFGTDLHFILGSGDFCLIDEVSQGGSCAEPAQRPSEMGSALTATSETFSVQVDGGVPSVLFGLAWDSGAPTLTLFEPPPGNRVIDANSVFPDVTVTITPTGVSEQTLIAIDEPLPGIWVVAVDNLDDGTNHDLVYFANKAPAVTFTVEGPTPITDDEALLSWETSIADPENYTISFYWEIRQENDRQASGPIVERLPLTADGSYSWSLDYLPGNGDPIIVYAQIENGIARVVTECGEVPYSADPEAPCSTMNHPELGLAGQRIDLGSIVYSDVEAPEAPTLTNVRPEGETSVMVRWEPNSERDLAGYVATCSQRGLIRQVRVTPHYPGDSTLREAVRVNGLDAGALATCSVQAYDATGNLSTASASDGATPTGDVPLPPAEPAAVGGLSTGIGDITLSWDGGDEPAGFLIFYELVAVAPDGRSIEPGRANSGGFQANEGPSPLDVGRVSSFTLSGLQPGASYDLWIKAYDADGRTSIASKVVTVRISDERQIFLPIVVQGP